MDISITLDAEAQASWQYWLDQYNASANPPITLTELVRDVYVGGKTERLAQQLRDVQLRALKPLGVKYLDATPETRDQVDELLNNP